LPILKLDSKREDRGRTMIKKDKIDIQKFAQREREIETERDRDRE
jgi:hypothetical protein